MGAGASKKPDGENNKDNPDAHCLPIGLMQRDVIAILYEAQGGVRQIFTDGRPLPKDPQPWWYGYSIGKWDGDTLVAPSGSMWKAVP